MGYGYGDGGGGGGGGGAESYRSIMSASSDVLERSRLETVVQGMTKHAALRGAAACVVARPLTELLTAAACGAHRAVH